MVQPKIFALARGCIEILEFEFLLVSLYGYVRDCHVLLSEVQGGGYSASCVSTAEQKLHRSRGSRGQQGRQLHQPNVPHRKLGHLGI